MGRETFRDDHDLDVSYSVSEETKQQVFDRVVGYFKEHKMYFSEGIHQSDECLIDAPNVMADLCDILQFETLDD